LKTLIVDDSSFAQRTLKTFLEKTFPDINVILAGNGRTGYAAFLREKPDAIITDLLMPELTGQEMIRQIREVDLRVPIFVLTADIQRTTKFDLAQYSVLAFINKPLNRENGEFIKQMLGALSHAE
jgi:two-component system, chemotaxis family, chemotaxis protein CheY